MFSAFKQAVRRLFWWRYRNSETGRFISKEDYERFPKAVTEKERATKP
jgi:hypothetical protein